MPSARASAASPGMNGSSRSRNAETLPAAMATSSAVQASEGRSRRPWDPSAATARATVQPMASRPCEGRKKTPAAASAIRAAPALGRASARVRTPARTSTGRSETAGSMARAGTRKLLSGGTTKRSALENGWTFMLNSSTRATLAIRPAARPRARRQGTRASRASSGPAA